MRMTDAVINPYDGAMYFTVGGRGGQSALHRVTYVGDESTAPAKAGSDHAVDRKLRRSLEALHKLNAAGAVAEAGSISATRIATFAGRPASPSNINPPPSGRPRLWPRKTPRLH